MQSVFPWASMEALFKGFYHEHISRRFLKIHAFCKRVAASHGYSLKQLFLNLCFVLKCLWWNPVLVAFKGCAFIVPSLFPQISVQTFSKCSFLVLPQLKSQKNDMKFRKIKSKIWKDIFIICIKFFCRLNYQNSYTLHWQQLHRKLLLFIVTTFF